MFLYELNLASKQNIMLSLIIIFMTVFSCLKIIIIKLVKNSTITYYYF